MTSPKKMPLENQGEKVRASRFIVSVCLVRGGDFSLFVGVQCLPVFRAGRKIKAFAYTVCANMGYDGPQKKFGE